MKPLPPLALNGAHYNVADVEKFNQGLALIRESLGDKGASMFSADNLIAWNRNLSFLRDPFFLSELKDPRLTTREKSTVWRRYLLLYFAKLSARLPGDFVELGCHKGLAAEAVIKRTNFAQLGKQYYLYDLFAWETDDEHRLEGHLNPRMYEDVVQRFASYPFVRVIKGSVPDSLSQGFPDAIAFAHIDMNHPIPEAAALEEVLPRLSSGGAVIFDDYGWWGYSAQKAAIDPILARHGLDIVELPTAQALLIKP